MTAREGPGLPNQFEISVERPREADEARPRRDRGGLKTVALAAMLLALLLVTRWHDLDALVTPDEPLWVARSANFYQALSSGDLEDTYQAPHPGVTTMWLGALGYRLADPDVAGRMGGQIETSDVRARIVPTGEAPIETLVELRRVMVVANALILVALFLCLIPLAGTWPALISAVFLGLDPMQIGFSRLLHLDGLSTNLLVLAVAGYCWHLLKGARTGLMVAGIATGLALLTRSVNGVLLPLLALLTIVDAIGTRAIRGAVAGKLRRHAISLLILCGVALATVFALWPALWVAPVGTIERVISGGSDLASAPHQRQLLFRGEIIAADPGWDYYPIVLIYRMTPVTLIGLALAAWAMAPRQVTGPRLGRRLIWNLACFAVAYIAILTLAAKKLDRYLLPSLAALNLVAALGACALIAYLTARLGANARAALGITIIGAVLMLTSQAIPAIRSAPYYLTYVSPLVGGEEEARAKISLGWGEGGQAVAKAVLAHSEIGPGEIAGGLWPQTIDYYLPYELRQAEYRTNASGATWFIDSHYVVVTEPEIQRQFYSPAMAAWFDSQEPLVTIRDDGRVYARIFDLAATPVPAPYLGDDVPAYAWGEARLVARTFQSVIEPGTDLRVRLYLETTGRPFYYWLEATVRDEQSEIVGRLSKRLIVTEADGREVLSVFDIELPADLPLGTYTVQLFLRDDETGEVLPGVHVVTGAETSRSVSLGTFTVVQDVNESTPEARSRWNRSLR